MESERSRRAYALWIPVVIALGLLTRPLKHYADALGAALGNAFYGVLIYLLIALALPRLRTVPTLVVATAICWVIEISQAYHTPGLDTFRHTLVGALTIGGTFHVHDLWCYLGGTVGMALVEGWVRRRRARFGRT